MNYLNIISAHWGESRATDALKFILRGFAIEIIFHFAQIAHSGYNGDSLGFGFYYSTYLGELAQGRYGLLLFSGRIVNPAIEFIGALLLYAFASYLLIEIMGMEISSFFALLTQGIFLSQPHIATYAGFTYASFPYTLAYVFMILSVRIVRESVETWEKSSKKSILFILISILAVAASFSIWQAYIPTFTTLVLVLLLFANDNSERLKTFFAAFASAIGGTTLYVVGMKFVNHIYDITPTEARGFSNVLSLNLPLLKEPVITIGDCYKIFVEFLLGNSIVYNGWPLRLIHGLLGLVMIVTVVLWVKGMARENAIVSVILLFLIPMTLCFYRTMSMEVSRVPWTYLHSMIFIWIILLAIMSRIKTRRRSLYVVTSLLIGYVICRQVYICNTNYHSLQARDIKSTAMAISMYTRLSENEDWSSDVPIMVVGSMDTIYPDNNWYYANTLKGWQPQLNEFVPYPGMPQNWVILINRIYGTAFSNIDYRWENYDKLLSSDEYEDMDIWPSKDSMKLIDGVMVLKLGEPE